MSTDGLHFTKASAPLLAPELEDEADAVGNPSVLPIDGGIAVFFTAVNGRAEPVVKRATCPAP